MSWKYPEHPIKSGGVVEIDDLNRNLGEFAQELDGGLNEHNWKKDSFNRTDCAEDVSMQVWETSGLQDPVVNPEATQDQWYRVRTQQAWFPIKSGRARETATQEMSITAKTSSCMLWILGSVQHRQKYSPSEGIVQYAIRVDGAVIPESITGGASTQTDISHYSPTNVHSTPTGYSTLGFSEVILGAGINQLWRSVSLDTMVPVTAGTHTVELVARMLGNRSGDVFFYVGARELIIVGMEK